MEKYFVRKNEESKFGYDFVVRDETGIETVTELRTKTTDNFLKCPKNDLDRTYIGLNKLSQWDFSQGDFELDAPVKRMGFSTAGTSPKTAVPSKGLEEYLEGEDKELFLQLVKKAETAKKTETLRAQIEQLQAQLEAMENVTEAEAE